MKITRVDALPIHAPRAHRFVGARAALTLLGFLEKHCVRSLRLKIADPGNPDVRACEAVRNRIGQGVTLQVPGLELRRIGCS